MKQPIHAAVSMLASFSLALSMLILPGFANPVRAQSEGPAAPQTVATITVNTGNNSNSQDGELSLYEALTVVTLAKNACFTPQEKNQIAGVSWILAIPGDCNEPFGSVRWNILTLDLFPAVIQFDPSVTDVNVDGALPALATMTTLNGDRGGGNKVRLLKGGSYSGPGLTITGCSGCSHDIYVHNLKIEGFTADGITNLTNGLTDSNFQGLEINHNGGYGIALSAGGSKNPRNITIGGSTAGEGNRIYANSKDGILLQGNANVDTADFNTLIQGNIIGLTPANAAFGNSLNGITLSNVRGVTIGGPTSASANTIVYSGGDGIKIVGSSANNAIRNNYVGADSGAAADRGNGASGISLLSGANNNTIEANLISGNTTAGIILSGFGTDSNTIQTNTIGLGVTSNLGNGTDGILVTGQAANNLIKGNSIGWNGSNGVHLSGSASGNTLEGNYIGVNSTISILTGNSLNGVLMDGAAHNNQIGVAGSGNWIGSNANDGVNIQGSGTTGNTVAANIIGLSSLGYSRPNNSGVALLNGATNNTIGTAGAGNIIVVNKSAGVFIADAGTTGNHVYANYIGINAGGNSGFGNLGAGVYIVAGANNNTVGAAGNLHNVISGNGGAGVDIFTNGNVVASNLIGTNLDGSAAVGNQNNGVRLSSGAQGNLIGFLNVVSGNNGDGIQVIGDSDNNYILGNTVGLNAAKTAKLPNTASGVALLDRSSGNLVGMDGAPNTVAGNSGLAGIFISDPGTDGNTVSANIIGTNQLSAFGLGNAGDGIQVTGSASNTVIGGSANAGDRNFIAGNTGNGIQINGAATTGSLVTGNYIGTNLAGNQALPNGLAGVAVIGAPNTTLGSETGAVIQCISGNLRQGIYAQDALQLQVLGATQFTQYIGNQCSGSFAGVGNGMEGILLHNTQHALIRPFDISYNGGAGIAVTGAGASANFLQPVINFANGGLPVDLGKDGYTPNDANDSDSGPNGLLNFPVVTHINGKAISGKACANCTIFVYLAVGSPSAPHGGAQLKPLVAFSDASGAWGVTLSGVSVTTMTLQACQAANCVVNPDTNTSELSPIIKLIFMPLTQR